MPVYEYSCDKCKAESEEYQSIRAAPLADCTACGTKGTLKRLISKTTFILADEGVGWARDGYDIPKDVILEPTYTGPVHQNKPSSE